MKDPGVLDKALEALKRISNSKDKKAAKAYLNELKTKFKNANNELGNCLNYQKELYSDTDLEKADLKKIKTEFNKKAAEAIEKLTNKKKGDLYWAFWESPRGQALKGSLNDNSKINLRNMKEKRLHEQETAKQTMNSLNTLSRLKEEFEANMPFFFMKKAINEHEQRLAKKTKRINDKIEDIRSSDNLRAPYFKEMQARCTKKEYDISAEIDKYMKKFFAEHKAELTPSKKEINEALAPLKKAKEKAINQVKTRNQNEKAEADMHMEAYEIKKALIENIQKTIQELST